ncbi:MAG: 30S ribosomal protein S3 [Thermoplasmata archaeon]
MASERKIVAVNLKRVLLKEYVMQETARAGFGGLDIQRTPMGTRITLFAERPGIVIGRRGASIKALTYNVDRNFDLDNPQIEVEEVANPAINAQIMAEKLASALERGWQFRRAGHSTLRRIMASGARGALIRLSGKLTSQRHRTQKFNAGHIKYNGEPKNLWVDQGFSTAKLKRGTIGVTVWITDPNAKFPDEIEVVAVEAPPEPSGPEEAPPTEEAPAEPTEAPPEEPEAESKTAEPAVEGEPASASEGPAVSEPALGSAEVVSEDGPEAPSKAEPGEEPTKPAPGRKKAKAAPKKVAAKKASAKRPAGGKAPKKKASATKKKTAAAKKGKEAD